MTAWTVLWRGLFPISGSVTWFKLNRIICHINFNVFCLWLASQHGIARDFGTNVFTCTKWFSYYIPIAQTWNASIQPYNMWCLSILFEDSSNVDIRSSFLLLLLALFSKIMLTFLFLSFLISLLAPAHALDNLCMSHCRRYCLTSSENENLRTLCFANLVFFRDELSCGYFRNSI